MKMIILVALLLGINGFENGDERISQLPEEMENHSAQINQMAETLVKILKRLEQLAPESVVVSKMAATPEDVSIVHGESDHRKPETNIEERMQILEHQMAVIKSNMAKSIDDVSIAHVESDTQRLNDTDLEQRVQILEFQMAEVQEDLGDAESDIQLVETQVTIIQSDQVVQDQRLLDVEDELSIIGSGIVNIGGAIDELKNADQSFDDRLGRLEFNQTVAFRAGFTEALPVIPIGSIAIFDAVFMDIGQGYDASTGIFTAPVDRAGLYYFSANFIFDVVEYNNMVVSHNGVPLCSAYADTNESTEDYGGSSCGVAVTLEQGDSVFVVHERGDSDTPVRGYEYASAFSGFLISPN